MSLSANSSPLCFHCWNYIHIIIQSYNSFVLCRARQSTDDIRPWMIMCFLIKCMKRVCFPQLLCHATMPAIACMGQHFRYSYQCRRNIIFSGITPNMRGCLRIRCTTSIQSPKHWFWDKITAISTFSFWYEKRFTLIQMSSLFLLKGQIDDKSPWIQTKTILPHRQRAMISIKYSPIQRRMYVLLGLNELTKPPHLHEVSKTVSLTSHEHLSIFNRRNFACF